MLATSVLREVGEYSHSGFFERDYSDRYLRAGYRVAFFDDITCLHIGKLTSDTTTPNAYALSNRSQFTGTKTKSPELQPTERLQTPWIRLEGYDFYANIDFSDGDREFVPKHPLQLKNLYDNDPEVVAFNTYGYVKKTIDIKKKVILRDNPNTPYVDGIYIKKRYAERLSR